MNIKCSVEGCDQIFSTTEPVSSDAAFLCREHTRHQKAERPANHPNVWPEARFEKEIDED